MQLDDVRRVLTALERCGVRYAVFGAIAMAAHGLDRATRDLDLFVAPDADNIDRLKQALLEVFDDSSIAEISADDLLGEYPVVQYGPPDVDYTIDIVSRLGDAFSFDDLDIVTVDAGDTQLHVVSPGTLYRMKHDTPRPRDRDDGERLRRPLTWRAEVPVRKYRRIEDVPEPPPARNALEGIRSACALSEIGRGLGHRFSAPRGVRRFRSIEEADNHRRSWEMPPTTSAASEAQHVMDA